MPAKRITRREFYKLLRALNARWRLKDAALRMYPKGDGCDCPITAVANAKLAADPIARGRFTIAQWRGAFAYLGLAEADAKAIVAAADSDMRSNGNTRKALLRACGKLN